MNNSDPNKKVVIIDGLKIYKLDIPRPLQLTEANGYFGMNERIGVWQDNYKTTVSDGYSTFTRVRVARPLDLKSRGRATASNPGWESYYSHSQINYYMRYLHFLGIDLYGGEMENFGVAKYGFVIGKDTLCLADIKTITELLQKNQDYRPDWVKDAIKRLEKCSLWLENRN